MSERVVKYRVFIASPSDVQKERKAAEDSIQEWNRLHSGEKGILFESLRWEVNATPDMDEDAQTIINRQLLEKADALIAIFWSKIGTPTPGFPSASIEEIKKFKGLKRWVYFCGRNVPLKLIDQAPEVKKFKEKIPGLYGTYKTIPDFQRVLQRDLTDFANKNPPLPDPITLRPYKLPRDRFQGTMGEWAKSENDGMILLYNIELETFRNAEVFNKVWGSLDPEGKFTEIILLLPKDKVRRLQRLLETFQTEFRNSPISDRFRYCTFRSPADEATSQAPKGVAFAMFRFGKNPRSGEIHPRTQVFVLAEPFSELETNIQGGEENAWNYAYAFNFHDHELIRECLGALWNKHFNEDEVHPVTNLLNDSKREKASATARTLIKDDAPPDVEREMDQFRNILRQRLFEPNVPSFFLNNNYFLLNWNSAFDLIFPTQNFCRGESVTKFIECLVNRDEVMAGGKDYVGQIPLFHLQELIFDSPRYGIMKFTKMASPVEDRDTGKFIGYDVALNINSVDDRKSYERDLKSSNGYAALLTRYAPVYDRIVREFEIYDKFVELHCAAVAGGDRILDLGAGPGYVTQKLLEMNKHVTAVDSNESMIEFLKIKRNRSKYKKNLRIVEQNIEKLYCPDESELAEEQKGKLPALYPPYDGAVLMNVAYALSDPLACLKEIHQLLVPGAVLAISGPKEDTSIANLFQAIENEHRMRSVQEQWDDKKELRWSADFDVFKEINSKLEREGFLRKFGVEDIKRMLREAGFEFRDEEVRQRAYVGDWMFIAARRSKG